MQDQGIGKAPRRSIDVELAGRMYEDGKTLKAIATEIGFSASAVADAVNKSGRKKRLIRYDHGLVAKLLREDGMTTRDAAKRAGAAESTIRRIRAKIGIAPCKQGRKKAATQQIPPHLAGLPRDEVIVALNADGWSDRGIARSMGIAKSTVGRVLDKPAPKGWAKVA